MSRRAFASTSLAAAVRAHFGLSQAELAAFVGTSRSHLAEVEAGRKALGPRPDQRLQVLARQLPPPDGQGPPPTLRPPPRPRPPAPTTWPPCTSAWPAASGGAPSCGTS